MGRGGASSFGGFEVLEGEGEVWRGSSFGVLGVWRVLKFWNESGKWEGVGVFGEEEEADGAGRQVDSGTLPRGKKSKKETGPRLRAFAVTSRDRFSRRPLSPPYFVVMTCLTVHNDLFSSGSRQKKQGC